MYPGSSHKTMTKFEVGYNKLLVAMKTLFQRSSNLQLHSQCSAQPVKPTPKAVPNINDDHNIVGNRRSARIHAQVNSLTDEKNVLTAATNNLTGKINTLAEEKHGLTETNMVRT